MIFAAGLGTRLRPLTDSLPKALIEVGGEPMIARVIRIMRDAGVSPIVVNVHYHADMLKKYLAEKFPEIIISDESDFLLDTGGGLVKAMPFLCSDEEPVIAYNADIFTDFPIQEMLAEHKRSGADTTLLAAERSTSRYLLFDADWRMRGWRNVATGEEKSPLPLTGKERMLAFGGVHILNPEMIRRMKDQYGETKFSVTPFYIQACADADIRAYTPSSPYNWVDIGRPETLAKAREMAAATQF